MSELLLIIILSNIAELADKKIAFNLLQLTF